MTSTWLPEQEGGEIEDIPYINPEKYANTSEPSKCYNGMIAPLTDYGFKGVLWYQGRKSIRKACGTADGRYQRLAAGF
ncbi:MAG: hypothetical protein V8S08_02020 [Lachnoclostridium sp.]